jgi:peptidoglycan/xylan/chitin deacetylase (PgdA/CDA1 family)
MFSVKVFLSMQSLARAMFGPLGLGVGRLAFKLRSCPAIRFLYYHSVSDLPVRSCVAPGMFAAQMEYLRHHGYRVLSCTEAVQYLAERIPVPEKSIVLTFDDGFLDNYEQAFPILERFKLPAIIFLAASYIGAGRLPTLTRTDFVPQPLTWEQVREMHAHGVEFGSHTLTHPMLSRISSVQARREVHESKRMIEDKLGSPVRFFCYPRGDFSPSIQQIVREGHYAAACSIIPGVNDWRTDLFLLKRTYISRRDTVDEFAKKMNGAYDFLQLGGYAWRRLRRA